MQQPSRFRQWIFYGIALSPLFVVVGALVYFVFLTNAFPEAYRQYIRNINFSCFDIVDQPYVYRMKPGVCHFDNAEYSTVQTIDQNGFRNANPAISYDAKIVLLGDSHTYGFSVNDEDTLNAQLKSRHQIEALNLGIPIYATFRELAAAEVHAPNAELLVLQYCENDFGENSQYLTLPPDQEPEIRKSVLANITAAKEVYEIRKAQGHPLRDTFLAISQVFRNHEYKNRWELKKEDRERNYEYEAEQFSEILARHKDYLKGRRLIVYESTSYGRNSIVFKAAFDKVLHREFPDLQIEVLDVSKVVSKRDYFWLDDHARPSFYAKIADLLAPHLKTGA
ncbi:MAG: SGNH/GDSL hydrolase family protein [Hydrogenophaga sp.]|nr:SGNH/GDSL hydrolase family protein [Hydrogenophaga sp.]